MAGKQESRTGRVAAFLSVLCWSIHFPLVFHRVSGATPPIVFYLHSLFWASIVSLALLAVSGRIDELSVINRKSGTLFLLVLSGGYGLWAMIAGALHSGAGGVSVELVFYCGPVFLVFLSMFTRNGWVKGRIWTALAGFAGAVFVLHNAGAVSFSSPASPVFAAAAAVCWSVFSLASASLLRKTEVFPALALLLSISVICLFATCLAMQIDVLAIGPGDILISMAVGALSIAGGLGLWMKSMELQVCPANAATWWYGALIFGAVWYHFFTDLTAGWATLIGAVLILLSLKTSHAGRERTEITFGDMVSGRGSRSGRS